MEKMCNSVSEERHIQVLNEEKRKQLKAEKDRIENGKKHYNKDQTDAGYDDPGFDYNQDFDGDDYGDEDANIVDTDQVAFQIPEKKDQIEEMQTPAKAETFPQHKWNAKVARYLAYSVDGGILCSQFTLTTLIKMLQNVSEPSDEKIIHQEIAYLLHIRRIGKEYDRSKGTSISSQLLELMQNYNSFSLNNRVLVVLIETGYCQQHLSGTRKDTYPKFLITVLNNCDRNYIKEACCKMIIKFFGKKKGGKNVADEVAQTVDANEGESFQMEFINLIEPLTSII